MKDESRQHKAILGIGILSVAMLFGLSTYSFAETVDTVQLGEGLVLEKTTTIMNVPKDIHCPGQPCAEQSVILRKDIQ